MIDFSQAAGNRIAPKPPFYFIREDFSGTGPKVLVRDANAIVWRVKGGLEVRPETFATRFVSALGYYADTIYFMARGRIEGVGPLRRASGFLKQNGEFTYASFALRDASYRFQSRSWDWRSNPFTATSELNGLKVLVMLLSNWDNKDSSDSGQGSNTGILQSSDGRRTIYYVDDWGQSLGSWGRFFGRSLWDCRAFTSQTESFIFGVRGGRALFGFAGQHTSGFRDGISQSDVRWLMRYLGKITDAQIRTGLLFSGATLDEERCFSRAVRARIERLRGILAIQ